MIRAARFAALAAAGIAAGAASGALGVGGGIILTPSLILVAALDDRTAAATSLAAIVPATVVGTAGYLVQGNLDFAAAGLMAAGGIGGTFLAPTAARVVRGTALRWAFVALMVLIAARMLLQLPAPPPAAPEPTIHAGILLLLVGMLMGLASGLFGIGGGFLGVPALVLVVGVDDLTAKGTALAAMIPICLLGALVGARARRVSRPHALLLGTTAGAASIGGVALAFALPRPVLTVAFVMVLLAAATQLALRTAREGRAPD